MTPQPKHTPYDAEIARYDALVEAANREGTIGTIWNNEHRLALARREGYLAACNSHAALLAVVEAVLDFAEKHPWTGLADAEPYSPGLLRKLRAASEAEARLLDLYREPAKTP